MVRWRFKSFQRSGNRDRATWVLVFLVVARGVAAFEAEPETRTQTRLPNVLLVLADDQTWFDSGAYGNGDVPTPNIDRLAREGMRFTHAFTGTAMCAPSRQQLYTGLYPVRSGAYPNHSVVRSGTRSLVHSFRERGYRVGLTGKTHFGPSSSFPFELVGFDSNPSTERQREVDLEASKRFVTRNPDEPFFLVVASNSPHTPWTKGERSRFDATTIQVPGHLVDTPETRAALVAYYAEITHLDDQLGFLLEVLDTEGHDRDTIVIYASEQGAALPFAKWTLYDAGVRSALVVRWPAQVAAGGISDAMVEYVDVLPTLLAAIGGEEAGLDGRSFLGVLRGERDSHREYVFGVQTTRGIIHGPEYPIRSIRSSRHKLILNLAAENTFESTITHAPRDAVFASWWSANPGRARAYGERPAVEFYDLETDPSERRNVAEDPANAELIASMRRSLEEWMRSVGDLGLETEREALRHMNPRIVDRLRDRFGEDAMPEGSASD